MVHFIDETVVLRVCLFAGLMAGLTWAKEVLPVDTGMEAVNRVFARHPKGKKEVWPVTGYPRQARVRPLQQSTFELLREYFSRRQQRNADEFLHAITDLITARDRLAKKLDIHKNWWPTGIDLLTVDAVLTQDLLIGRADNPDNMSISSPKVVNDTLEFTVQEVFTEVGQDRVLGRGHRTSVVTLISEKNRWVIDEIATTTTDAYKETTIETLTRRLQNAIKPLHAAQHSIEKLPQTLEIRKGVKAEN